MRIFVSILALITLTGKTLQAQIMPKEGTVLHYRIIGFSEDIAGRQGKNYELRVAEGIYSDESTFLQHASKPVTGKYSRITGEVPEFGKSYTWSITAVAANGTRQPGILHHFSTLPLPKIKGAETRILTTKKATAYRDAYFFNDGTKTLYTIDGMPVWFLPSLGGLNNETSSVRDMKLSVAGTISLLLNNVPYEISYEGDVLWKAPQPANPNDVGEGDYHHEFTRASNGHYMVMGNEMALWQKGYPGQTDSNSITLITQKTQPPPNLQLIPFTTLVEFSTNGSVLWRWRSIAYFKQSDIFNHRGLGGSANIDAHANSFFFDERQKKVYVSFKDIERVIAIKYPEGIVSGEYGEHFEKGRRNTTNPLFSEQHAVKVSRYDGTLYLFNDNIDHTNASPSVVVLKEPLKQGAPLTRVWEYICPTGPESYDAMIIDLARHGGNVEEIDKGVYFVSMCSPYWNLFIVNRQKQLLWEATPQFFDVARNKWQAVDSYRSSIVKNKRDLERMIWLGYK